MKIKPREHAQLTPSLVYLRGEFGLTNYKIPFFSVIVSLRFAQDHFRLIDDIPRSEQLDWSIEELFQRDIDWKRIDTEIVRYLKDEDHPQFFNSLTIALLPSDGYGFSGEYKIKQVISRMEGEDLDSPIQVGGIQFQSIKGTEGKVGEIRWDAREIIPIAVDGQHRLAAIKQLYGKVKLEKLDQTLITVIFLVLDERVGFIEPPQPKDNPSIQVALRRIFIDLNKYARNIPKAREILLDDKDIGRVCTRLMIGERLSGKKTKDRIPLPLIDWISEKNKFDEGPFITTVLLLNEIIAHALEIPKSMDLDDEKDINKKFRRWLKAGFKPSQDELNDLLSQVQRCYDREIPLSFTKAEIDILSGRFEKLWRPLIYRVFSELKPYRELWKYGEDNNLHTPEFVDLYVAKEITRGKHGEVRAKKIIDAIKLENPDWSEEKNYEILKLHIENNIKLNNWAFKVIFQRGLFWSFKVLLEQVDLFLNDKDEEIRRNKFTTLWIEALNNFFIAGLGSTIFVFSKPKEKFWIGIGLRLEGPVEFTKVGSKRISHWISLWVCMYWLAGKIPSYSTLENDQRPLAGSMKNILESNDVYNGMYMVAEARNPNASMSKLKEETEKLIVKRFNYMKSLIEEFRDKKQ